MSPLIYRLIEITPPVTEPLALDDIKTFLRVDHDNDDDLISALIIAARQFCEINTGRSLLMRSSYLFLDAWPQGARELALPGPPLIAVTCINVYDDSDVAAEFSSDDYFVDIAGAPGRVVLRQGATPPLPTRVASGIEIHFTAGYGDEAYRVPALLLQGMKQIIAHLYEHRGDSMDQALLASGAAALFQPYRLMSLA